MKSMTAEQRNHMLLCDPVSRVIPKLAVPTIISMLITNIYNMADTFFVSQLGTSASGAVGVIFSAMAIIQAVSFMIGMGAGTHVSQALGAGNREKADAYASTSFFTAFIVGVILAFFSLTNIDAVVRFLGSTETIAPYAKDYATYIFYAMPFMMCSFVMNNLLRFEGLTMYGMVGITTGGILNAYILRTGAKASRDELRRKLENETWLTAPKAKELNLVNSIIGEEGFDPGSVLNCAGTESLKALAGALNGMPNFQEMPTTINRVQAKQQENELEAAKARLELEKIRFGGLTQ